MPFCPVEERKNPNEQNVHLFEIVATLISHLSVGETLGYTIMNNTIYSMCCWCDERVWLRFKHEHSSFHDMFDIIHQNEF